MNYYQINSEKDYQLFIDQLQLLIERQADPAQYNYLAIRIDRSIQRTLSKINDTPQNESEHLMEELWQLKQMQNTFCENHPFAPVAGKEKILKDFFSTNVPVFKFEAKKRLPFGWLLPIDALKDLYTLLLSNARIQCQYQTFEPHFLNSKPYGNKIWWYGPITELVHLISNLIDNEIIPDSKFGYLNVTSENFCNDKGEMLNKDSLSTLKTRGASHLSDKLIQRIVKHLLSKRSSS